MTQFERKCLQPCTEDGRRWLAVMLENLRYPGGSCQHAQSGDKTYCRC